MPRKRSPFLFAPLAVCACFGSGGGNVDTSANGLCTSDSDCGTQSVCVAGNCRSPTGYPCLVVTDCRPPSTVCLNGTCQAGCTNDSECPAGLQCNPSSGECGQPLNAGSDGGPTPPSTCQSSVDCPTGFICSFGTCVGCNTNSDCSNGQICNGGVCSGCSGNSQCGLGEVCLAGACSNCTSSAQCNPGQVCIWGTCTTGCTSSTQCPGGQVCDSSTQQCRACVSNADCGGSACVNGACQAPCTSNAQCNNGEVCTAGICGPCSNASQCATGQICASGACSPCSSNSQCPSGQVCNSGSCGSCSSNAQCASGQVCANGTCGACTASSQCGSGQVCSNGTCQTGGCTSNSQCPSGQICSNGQCSACPTWTGSVQTYMNNYCTGCHGSFGKKSSVINDASRIQSTIDNGSMPISPPWPTQAENTMVDNWFSASCNMP